MRIIASGRQSGLIGSGFWIMVIVWIVTGIGLRWAKWAVKAGIIRKGGVNVGRSVNIHAPNIRSVDIVTVLVSIPRIVDVQIETYFYQLVFGQLLEAQLKAVLIIIAQHVGLVISINLSSADVVKVCVFEIIEIDFCTAFFPFLAG